MKKILLLSFMTIAFSLAGLKLLDEVKIEQVVDVLSDGKDQVVILQKETADNTVEEVVNYFKPKYSLLVSNANGEVYEKIQLPKDKRSTFSEYDNLTMDQQGNFYLHRTQKNSADYFVFREEVLKISSDGKTLTTLYSINSGNKGGAEYSLISKVYPIDRFLYIIERSSGFANQITVSKVNLYSLEVGKVKEIQVDPLLNFSELLYLSDEKIVLSTMSGKLYEYSSEGTKAIQYKTMAAEYHPSRLFAADSDSFSFYDLASGSVYSIHTDLQQIQTLRTSLFDIHPGKNLTYDDLNGIYIHKDLSISGNFRINKALERYVFIDNYEQTKIISDLKPPLDLLLLHFLKYLAFFGVIAWIIWLGIHYFEKGSGSLIIKFGAILLPLVLMIPLVSLTLSFSYFTNLAKNDLFAELYHITRERAAQLNGDQLTTINGLSDYGNEAYQSLSKKIEVSADSFNKGGHNTYDRWYYSVLYRFTEGKVHAVTGDAISFWTTTDFTYGEKANSVYQDAATGGRTILGENSDLGGDWVFSVTPIYNSDQQVVGLLEVGTGQETYTFFIQKYYGILTILNLSIVLMVLLLMGINIYRVIKPLRELNASVEEVNSGKWGVTVPIRSRDEIGNLSALFNQMSLFIKDYITELSKLNEMYYKFIPLKFFELMEKKSILENNLGDYSKQEMTVTFIDTHNYFELVNTMKSQEQLDLLNSLFEAYASAIHAHNGLVGEFRNAGVLALFTNPDDAMNAAYRINQRMGEMNDQIKTTISIHFGEVLLGIVGNERRMTTAVISSCVNEAVSLNKLAGKFGCAVVLTETSLQAMKKPPQNHRFIGMLSDDQHEKHLRIHEWLETVPVGERNDYMKSLEDFNAALDVYAQSNYEDAKKYFIRVIKENPADLVSKEYLYKCEAAILSKGYFESELGRF